MHAYVFGVTALGEFACTHKRGGSPPCQNAVEKNRPKLSAQHNLTSYVAGAISAAMSVLGKIKIWAMLDNFEKC
jgi:hypothetical protein